MTDWVSDQALGVWLAPRRMTRGGQRRYSDLAIEICLALSAVYDHPLRQTRGVMRSIATLLGVDIAVPEFSTLSRRGKGLTLPALRKTDRSEPVHLVVDSADLKIFGEGEWCVQTHKTQLKRKHLRKLHLGFDLVSGEISCVDLTASPGLLDQIASPVAQFLAGGASDGGPTGDLLTARFEAMIEVPFLLPRMPARASMRYGIRRHVTCISPRSQPAGGWPGRKPLATINAAEVRLSWAAGKQLLRPS